MDDRVCLAALKLNRHSECGKMYLWTARSWWNNAELLTDIFCRSYIVTRKSGVLDSIPGLATYFRFSFRSFKKGSCQLLAKVLLNRLVGLSLPRKCVVRLTDRPDMTLDFYRGRKTAIQQKRPNWLKGGRQFHTILTSLRNLFTHNYYPVRCWQVLLALQWPLMQNFG